VQLFRQTDTDVLSHFAQETLPLLLLRMMKGMKGREGNHTAAPLRQEGRKDFVLSLRGPGSQLKRPCAALLPTPSRISHPKSIPPAESQPYEGVSLPNSLNITEEEQRQSKYHP